jgi:hypothetical protein
MVTVTILALQSLCTSLAVTLHKLGDVLAQTGDLKQAMRYLQESSQMAARRRFKIYGLILSQYHSLLESFE